MGRKGYEYKIRREKWKPDQRPPPEKEEDTGRPSPFEGAVSTMQCGWAESLPSICSARQKKRRPEK